MGYTLDRQFVREIEAEIADAARRVMEEEISQAVVSLQFTVALDKDGNLSGQFTRKYQKTQKGEFDPQPGPRLPLAEDVSVAFARGEREPMSLRG